MQVAKMVSLAQSPEKVKESVPEIVADNAKGPTYPWGLCLRLEKEQLEKLKLKANVGDTIHVFALGKVTSVSEREESASVEIQLTDMAAENEDAENEAADPEETERKTNKRWYGRESSSED